MHLKLYEYHQVDDDTLYHVGDVYFGPYSFTYDGWNEKVEEYLSSEPDPYTMASEPDANELSSMEVEKAPSEEAALKEIGSMAMRRGVSDWEIVDG